MSEFKGTKGEWKCHLARMRPEDRIFGYSIRADGKEPYVASAGVSLPHCALIVDPEYRSAIPECFTEEEVEANGRLIAEAGTVANETGLTPRQLVASYEALVGLVKLIDSRHDLHAVFTVRDSVEYTAARSTLGIETTLGISEGEIPPVHGPRMLVNVDEYRELAERVKVLEGALRQVDRVLRCPAAEYVPAISDAFSIIDATITVEVNHDEAR